MPINWSLRGFSTSEAKVSMSNEISNESNRIPHMNSLLKLMVYAVDVGDKPTVAFEAASLARARALSRELWFRVYVSSVTSNHNPLWDGEAALSVRPATPSEMMRFWRAAEASDKPSEALAYLVETDFN
jgi:hypothetical protein